MTPLPTDDIAEATTLRDSKGRPRPVPRFGVPVADTHAHLQMLDDPAAALARCAWLGIGFVCCMVDPSESVDAFRLLDGWRRDADRLLERWSSADPDHLVAGERPALPDVRLMVGVHPHNAKRYTARCERLLLECAADPRTAGIGEIGLDYHYDLSPRELQQAVFRRQLDLADELGMPVSLHLREAHADALAILREHGVPAAGCLVHCFNRDAELLAPFLELGCRVAFGGPLTFKNSDDVRESATTVPLGHLLTETDCPYMTPEPCRGTRCEPAHTLFTAQRLAQVVAAAHPTDADEDDLLRTWYDGARSLLDRPATPWQCDGAARNRTMEAATGCLSDEESALLVERFPDDGE